MITYLTTSHVIFPYSKWSSEGRRLSSNTIFTLSVQREENSGRKWIFLEHLFCKRHRLPSLHRCESYLMLATVLSAITRLVYRWGNLAQRTNHYSTVTCLLSHSQRSKPKFAGFQTNQTMQDTPRLHFSGVSNGLLQVMGQICLCKDLQNCHYGKECTRGKPLREFYWT